VRDVVDAFIAGDAAKVVALLGPRAVFHSPVTDYEGPERVEAVLEAVVQVIGERAITAVHETSDETVAFFTGVIQGRAGEGVLRVRGSELTLMVRPLKALLRGIEEMERLLG
jgi:16S rRNA C1402 (ribose-2'-O) methylase RsmI